MNFADSRPTGRENVLVLYCPKCGWNRESHGAMVNACPDCRNRYARQGHERICLNFVSYERGSEEAEAERVIGAPLMEAN